MKIIVSTHQGVIINEETDYILVHNEDGEFGILNNHVPVVAVIKDGYVKITAKEKMSYIYLCGAMFEFHGNNAVVLAQEAKMSDELQDAKNALYFERNKRIEANRKDIMDFSKKEKELRDHVKNAKAGGM